MAHVAKVFTLRVKVYFQDTAKVSGDDIARDIRNRLYDLEGIVDVQASVEGMEPD